MEMAKTPNPKLTQEEIEHYSNALCSLWESYIKYLHVGMACAGFTIILVAEYLKIPDVLRPEFGPLAKYAMTLAGFAGICFGLCRWLSQIIMERQVYGEKEKALKYFELCDSRPANALRYNSRTIARFYDFNDVLKFAASIALLLSWALVVYILWARYDVLSAAVA